MSAELAQAIAATSAWEGLAVALAIAYLLLAVREHIACWACALISTTIYTGLFWNVSLLMESALNVYYMLMALYGWQQWRRGGRHGGGVSIDTWTWQRHTLVIAGVLAAAGANGYLLATHTSAVWPYVDSFTTWGAVVTTFMVARKVLENWIYWFVIDAISIPLYIERGLVLSALLFAVYLIIVCFGFIAWRRQYRREHAAPA
ncbi:MAG: nicotinamide riboside transporter PnuC [Gammaproteobacteria bacterium]